MASTSDPQSVLPLSDAAFAILVALAAGERHGYAIIKEVEDASGGAVTLGPTTLYRTIKQMLADGWIVETATRDDEDQRRRYYALSKWGRRVANAEMHRLEGIVRFAQRRLGAAHAR
jgi:DNA-binding PadR family transcriptional regulator